MSSLLEQLEQAREWFISLFTGRSDDQGLDEEHYRQRILVMTSVLWMAVIITLTLVTPLIIDLTPEGRTAAHLLFVATGFSMLVSMLVLRYLDNRILALHLLLLVFTGAFTLACVYFGGTRSPTYVLLILAPVMAGIVGSVRATVFWVSLVLLIWTTILGLERIGVQFQQIILPQNYNIAITLAYAATGIAVVSVIIVYAEMNKHLRNTLQSANAELGFLSSHDDLTGLYNRRYYDERLTFSLARAKRHGSKVGLMIFDLDRFKAINDDYGHSAGDHVLREIAQRVRHCLREIDMVARLGGDEFAVVVDDIHSMEEVAKVALKLQQAIAEPLPLAGRKLTFGASFGFALYPDHAQEQRQLEELADRAMYRSKKSGTALYPTKP